MKQSFFILCNYLVVAVFLTACVDPLEFSQVSEDEFVLINGVISNSPGERTITVSRGLGIDSKEFTPIDVRGNIYRDGQLWDQLAVQGIGELYVPFNLKLEEGRSYEIEIMTPDNEVFRSNPKTIQPRAFMDSLSFETERRFSGVNFSGLPKTDMFVDIFAHVNLPAGDENEYYRWQVDGTFSFIEVARTGNPNDPIETCYISHFISENPSSVLSSEGLAAGDARHLVNSRVADQSFLFRHIINVYLHSTDRESYEYYERAIRLSSGSGSLYDEVPSPLKGNVIKTEGNPETVLGYIDFSLADTMRISLAKGKLGVSISNVCESLTPCRARPAIPGGGNVDPIYCICWDCNLALPNATLIPPFFWDE